MIEKLCLFLLTRQPVQHCAAALREKSDPRTASWELLQANATHRPFLPELGHTAAYAIVE
jgi:hypothetical protein